MCFPQSEAQFSRLEPGVGSSLQPWLQVRNPPLLPLTDCDKPVRFSRPMGVPQDNASSKPGRLWELEQDMDEGSVIGGLCVAFGGIEVNLFRGMRNCVNLAVG